MKATNFLKLAMAASLVIGMGFLISPSTNATSHTIGSSVTIGIPVTVNGDFDLLWGDLAAPSAGIETWVIDCGAALSGGDPGNDLFPGDHQLGQFTISGQPGATVNFSVDVTPTLDFSVGDPALLLHTPDMCVASPYALNGISCDLVVTVGASLNVGSTATAGDHTDGEISMTANY